MRLIDADAVEKITWQDPSYFDPLNVLTEVREKVRALPTIDAVPVIRCKDCVKYKIFNDSYCPWIEQEVEEDFFCADGKRREE